MRQIRCDVLVIGAGPAGLAAVQRLLRGGADVGWVDDQAQPGGQIWRGAFAKEAEHASRQSRHWAVRLQALHDHPRLQRLAGQQVVAAESEGRLRLHAPASGAAAQLRYERLILATGARERHLPLPGWTLPGVHGAGGLQALVKGGWPVQGRRIVLAGSGPLLLASAATLQAAGARVTMIAEQSPRSALLRFALGLPLRKLAQATALRLRLRNSRYLPGCWPVAVLGENRAEALRLSDGRRHWDEPCDAIGLGFGLLPNTELAELLGCALADGAISVDARLQTSSPGIYAAGECTGIGGVDKALIEGELAAAALLDQPLAALQRLRWQQLDFAGQLARGFALAPRLKTLADDRTLVCRCEDISWGELRQHDSWRAAKLQTRCGMGACQGRICGPITTDCLGWESRGLRAPLQPVPLASLLPDDPAQEAG